MAAERQRGLGRGLSALLGEADAADEQAMASSNREERTPSHVPVEALRRNPDQPRQAFGDPELSELTDSIREKGVLQPILVRPHPDEPSAWQIVAGERRWRAAQRAGLPRVPVLVRELSDSDVLEMAVVENVQRADLTPIEEAQGYRTLMERFGRTQEAVAKIVGKSRSHVANALRLLDLPEPIQKRLETGLLTVGHARAILTAPNRDELAVRIVREGLNVRQAEALARRAQEPPPPAKQKVGARRLKPRADTAALEADLTEIIGIPKVQIHDRGGKGEIRLTYASLEQLDDLCERLTRTPRSSQT